MDKESLYEEVVGKIAGLPESVQHNLVEFEVHPTVVHVCREVVF